MNYWFLCRYSGGKVAAPADRVGPWRSAADGARFLLHLALTPAYPLLLYFLSITPASPPFDGVGSESMCYVDLLARRSGLIDGETKGRRRRTRDVQKSAKAIHSL
ncbi:hypothetical protein LINPERHAP1_LOCUS6631 [Linum perenne]